MSDEAPVGTFQRLTPDECPTCGALARYGKTTGTVTVDAGGWVISATLTATCGHEITYTPERPPTPPLETR